MYHISLKLASGITCNKFALLFRNGDSIFNFANVQMNIKLKNKTEKNRFR